MSQTYVKACEDVPAGPCTVEWSEDSEYSQAYGLIGIVTAKPGDHVNPASFKAGEYGFVDGASAPPRLNKASNYNSCKT